MKLLDYVKHPKEYVDKKESWKHLAVVVVIFFSYSIIVNLLNILLFTKLCGIEIPERTVDLTSYPLMFLLLVPPLVEEFAFRFGLRRTKLRVLISTFLITFLIFSKVMYSDIYCVNAIFQRLIFPFMIALIVYSLLYKYVKRIKFPIYFYSLCVLFAMVHLLNYYPFDLSALAWFYISLYAIIKIPSALILGYVRMGYGFLYSLTLHTLFNAPFIIAYFMLN